MVNKIFNMIYSQINNNEFYDPILKKNVPINNCIELKYTKNIYNK